MELTAGYYHPSLKSRASLRIRILLLAAKNAEAGFGGKLSVFSNAADLNRRAERYMQVYGNQIVRFAYTYVHNMFDAEDILQETLIKVLEANPHFENEAHEKAYLLKAAANCAKNRIAAITRHKEDELDEQLAAEEREDLSFVWDAVKSLPDTQREVVHLFYQEGYQTAEIAEILGRKDATIRSDLKRARETLKEILKEEYDFG